MMMNVTPDETEVLKRAHARLVAAAADEGILDVAYRFVDTPVGVLLLAGTERGLVRVAFENQGYDAVLQVLADRVSPRVLLAPSRLDDAAREIDDYFTHGRASFDLPLDLRLASGFRREVLTHLRDVPYGATASYATLAAAAGNPKAVRAVGTACATNPLPLVIPCHRIVRSDGGIGNYAGGVPAKQALLQLEAAA
jgi:methylated-DNA-[protein]-cysteine S-methyltransferase